MHFIHRQILSQIDFSRETLCLLPFARRCLDCASPVKQPTSASCEATGPHS